MLTYFNLVPKDDLLQRPSETWGLFKRNASSYVGDLCHSADQSDWKVNLIDGPSYPQNTHDFNAWVPSDHTLQNNLYKLDVVPSNTKLCIRDPLHRYCSGLVMIRFDLEETYNRPATMEPYYHNGGRDEILADYSNQESEFRTRYLYCWRKYVRSLHHTIFLPGNVANRDYTFGESHLDPTLSIAGLLPYLHEDACIQYVDLRKWTEYTTGALGIEETVDEVDKWNSPKKTGLRNKIAQPGHDLFKVLQKELALYFTKDARAYGTNNWQPTFEDWLESETKMYQFFKENPIIAHGSEQMDKLTKLLVEICSDPYFFYKSWAIRRNFADPQILEKLPNLLALTIKKTMSDINSWEIEMRQRRFKKTDENQKF